MKCDACELEIFPSDPHVLVLAYPERDAMRIHADCARLANPLTDVAHALTLRSSMMGGIETMGSSLIARFSRTL